jgi:hypothetical protein
MSLLYRLSPLLRLLCRREGERAMMTLRYEPEIAARVAPDAIRTTIRDPDKTPAPFSNAKLMLNYQTNARNGALVRFNPVLRSGPAPASPHPGPLQPSSKAVTSPRTPNPPAPTPPR